MSRTRPIYQKRPMVRKRTTRSNRPTRVQTRARQLARQMVNQRTAGFVGMELKFFDTSRLNVAPGNNGNMTGGAIDPTATDCLNSPAQGNSQTQRIGRKITMKNLTVKGMIKWNASATDTTPIFIPPVMIAIVLDTQNNSASGLSSGQVFQNPGNAADMVANPLRNLEYTSRYKVLWKRVYYPQMSTTSVAGAPNIYPHSGIRVPFSIYLNLKNMVVLYNAENGNSTDITDNAIHILAFGQYGTNAGEVDVDIDYNSRLRFVG